MYNAPYMGVANNLAGYGRYGDSMLVHMNPVEVQMLSRMSPTGQLTRNPMTGQPEAFLPFLAPILGSLAGSSLLTGVGAGGILGAAGLSSAAAGAIGSALGTTLATGDLEQGIMSGITGYGLGGALGKVASLGNKAAQSAAADLATQQSAQKILDTSTAEALSKAQAQEAAAVAATKGSMASDTLPSAGLESVTQATQDPTYLAALQRQQTGAADVAAAQQALTTAQRNIPASEIAMGPLRRPGAFFSELAQPSTYLPAYVGESARMQKQMEEEGEMSAKRFAEEQEGERARARGQIGSVYSALSSAYPGVRYADGGFVVPPSTEPEFTRGPRGIAIRNPNYTTPASSNAEIDKFSASMGMPSPTDVQLSLRGQYALTPPTASYSALDVGGEGYLPGIAPEFQYFTDIDPNAPPSGGTGDGTGGTDYGTGGTDDGIEPDFGKDGYSNPAISSLFSQAASDAFRKSPQSYESTDESQFPISQPDMSSQPTEDDLYALRAYRDQLFGIRDEFAEGGMTGLMEEAPEQDDSQSLIRMTVSAIRGEVENADQIIKAFVEQYGTEAFMQLREAVLQSIVPGAQTNGMVEGDGGGQDDMVEGMIGDRQRVAVSPGEYIVPADVVSLAGGGYSGDGAKFFDGLVDDIRQKTMGTTEQVKPYRSGV